MLMTTNIPIKEQYFLLTKFCESAQIDYSRDRDLQMVGQVLEKWFATDDLLFGSHLTSDLCQIGLVLDMLYENPCSKNVELLSKELKNRAKNTEVCHKAMCSDARFGRNSSYFEAIEFAQNMSEKIADALSHGEQNRALSLVEIVCEFIGIEVRNRVLDGYEPLSENSFLAKRVRENIATS